MLTSLRVVTGVRAVAWGLLVVLGLLLLWAGYRTWLAPAPEEPVMVREPVATSSAAALTKSAPVRVRIPSVGIDATFEGELGLNPDQTIEVPESFTQLGWYGFGPTPGELGPAVILGHVDSYRGPAVFWPLGQLEVGNEILVDREDGTVARFMVTELRRVDQDEFPTRDVYGDIDHAGLRLITCSGTYDRGVQRYSHNLIVFARLLDDVVQ